MSCLFCDLVKHKEKIIYENDKFYAIYDSFPVNLGHVLIISKRHVVDYFGLSEQDIKALDQAIREVKVITDKLYKPNGYNIGINNGEVAGQTIMHLHVHLIPRYLGDSKNPRGGVRGVIPEKQKY
ncbi:MAG: HIT family protein [Tenericutes bacterium HGW-Tenericutes-5]|jgi:diadenosine tetraphosphate (Ap4A) HIT family hydrolase|nr:MAG: HIT family protein [Tenericutes bacterium HGW-Tenericutes-5]